MPEFSHLHLHTQYSLLDGAIRLKELFPAVLKMGMKSVAITDHGNLFGSVQFYKQAKAAGVKPVLGCEAYICDDRHDRTVRKRHHLILLARNEQGWANLRYLNSMAHTEGFYYYPRIDKKLLREHSVGLIGLSACLGSEIAKTLLLHGTEAATEAAREYASLFEAGDFYLEVQPNGLAKQDEVNETYQRISRATGIPLVATGDCHYLRQSDAAAHDVLMAVQMGKSMADGDRLAHRVDSYYVKSPEEFSSYFATMPDAVENAGRIAARCNVDLKLGKSRLPRYEVPAGETTANYFAKVAREGLEVRFAELADLGLAVDQDQYRARLEFEIGVIQQMDFPGYFLIVWDFIKYAKSRGIPVGPGRGSGAGSLVAYSLKITDLDPIPYGLLFERFLNPDRVSMPDFDIDFCKLRRGEVIEYVAEKYGRQSVAQIATFSGLSARSAIRDVGRVFGLPFQRVSEIVSSLPKLVDQHPPTVAWAVKNSAVLQGHMAADPLVRQVVEIAERCDGLYKSWGTHAAGVVISDGPMYDTVPVCVSDDGGLVSQFDMGGAEAAGLVKFDFLGLKNLTSIDLAVKLILRREPSFDLRRIPMDDAATFELMSTADTHGVFQMGLSGFRDMLRRLRPSSFEDVIAAGALYRPGPLESGMVDDFIRRKHGLAPVEYVHPSVEPVLAETYGTIVYQEQVLSIARILAGYTLGGADLLRRAIGKKKAEEMAKEKAKFLDGCKRVGLITDAAAAQLFDSIEVFANYSFNKSHSAGYGLLSYQTAYLKAHYPAEFLAALASSEERDKIGLGKALAEIRAKGLVLLPPHVNASDLAFGVENGAVRFGLASVSGASAGGMAALIAERKRGGAFTSLFNLCARLPAKTLPKATVEILIRAGALAGIVPSRAAGVAMLPVALERAQKAAKDKARGQVSLFSLLGQDGARSADPEPAYPAVAELSAGELLAAERAALGFYVSGHPLDTHAAAIRELRLQQVEALDNMSHGSEVKIAGLIGGLEERTTKAKQELMAEFQIEGRYSSVAAVCFARDFAKVAGTIRTAAGKAQAVALIGNLQVEVAEEEDQEDRRKVVVRGVRML